MQLLYQVAGIRYSRRSADNTLGSVDRQAPSSCRLKVSVEQNISIALSQLCDMAG